MPDLANIMLVQHQTNSIKSHHGNVSRIDVTISYFMNLQMTIICLTSSNEY